jgi:hypothetical protein
MAAIQLRAAPPAVRRAATRQRRLALQQIAFVAGDEWSVRHAFILRDDGSLRGAPAWPNSLMMDATFNCIAEKLLPALLAKPPLPRRIRCGSVSNNYYFVTLTTIYYGSVTTDIGYD